MTYPSSDNSLDWLLSNFAREVPGVSHAVLVSVEVSVHAGSMQQGSVHVSVEVEVSVKVDVSVPVEVEQSGTMSCWVTE